MAISLRAAGTATAATVAVTSINPSVPTGATTGDLSVLTVWMKPYNATITTPTDWTKIGEHTNGTTASGTDTGSTKVAVYVRESAPVGAIGVIGVSGGNSGGAVINTYQKASNEVWNYAAFTQGFDNTNAANYSATGDAGLDVKSGDWVLQSTAVNGDVGTLSAFAIGGMSGATLGTYTNRQSAATTTGNDSRGVVGDVPITAGTSTAAPTFTYTNASSGSGTTIWLRLRVGLQYTQAVTATPVTSTASMLRSMVKSINLSGTVSTSAARVLSVAKTVKLSGGGTAPTFQDAMYGENGVTDIAVEVPSCGGPGDLMLVLIEGATATQTISPPEGWTTIVASTTNVDYAYLIAGKILGTGEMSFTFTSDVQDLKAYGVVALRGVNASWLGNIDTKNVNVAASGTTSTSVTTSGPAQLVTFASMDVSTAVGFTIDVGTERIDQTIGTEFLHISAYTEELTSAGTYTRTITSNAASAQDINVNTIEIKGTTGGGSGKVSMLASLLAEKQGQVQTYYQNVTASVATTASRILAGAKALPSSVTMTATDTLTANKTLTDSVTGTASDTLSVGKILLDTVAGTASDTLSVSKGLLDQVVSTAVLTSTKVFLRDLAATCSSVATAVRATSKTILDQVTTTSTDTLSVSKPLTDTLTTTATRTSSVAKTLSDGVSATATVDAVKAFLRSLTAGVTSTATSSRSVSKTLADQVAATGSVIKQAARTLTDSVTVTATLTASKALLRALSASVTSTATALRAVSITRTTLGSITATLSRAGAKTIAASTSIAPLLDQIKAKFVTLSDTVSITASDTLSVSKSLVDTVTATGSFLKAVSKSLTDSVASTSTMVASKAFLRTLSASVTASASLARVSTLRRALSASSTITGTLRRAVSKTVTDQVAATGSAIKQAARTLTDSVTATASLTSSRAYLRTLADTVTSTATLRRAASKTVSASASAVPALTKRASKTVSGSVSAVATQLRATTRGVTMTAVVTAQAGITRLIDLTVPATVEIPATVSKAIAFTVAATSSLIARLFPVRGGRGYIPPPVIVVTPTPPSSFVKVGGMRGPAGPTGPRGPVGVGIPSGGVVGDVLHKAGQVAVWAMRSRVLVLDVGEPIPEGTPRGTIIVRRSV